MTPPGTAGPGAWLATTSRRAGTNLFRFLKFFVPITLIFALARLSTGVDVPSADASDFVIVILAMAGAMYTGAFVFAAIIGQARAASQLRRLSAWTASGAMTLLLVVIAVVVADRAVLGEEPLLRSPWFWLGVALVGALVGYAYGRVAQDIGS
jgi:multisubunit Na+/H+ antiporter MnhG subunit